jgi:N,N'-diacetylchitobiose transport system substrate-binding protein
VALCATAALAVAGCGSGSGSSTSPGSAAPASLTVWRMGASTPAQVTWMNGVVSQFHKAYPAYAKTKVNVVYVPWTNATTEFTNALSSGKNTPDVTKIGNTEPPTNASLGMLANITSNVNAWSNKSDVVSGMLANDTQNGSIYGVPWFGGVRGTSTARTSSRGPASRPPRPRGPRWSATRRSCAEVPQHVRPGRAQRRHQRDRQLHLGAGGQVAVQKNAKWVAELNSPQSEAGLKFHADLYLCRVSPRPPR